MTLLRGAFTGARDTGHLMASRWRGMSANAHVLIFFAGLFAIGGLFSAANLGTAVKVLAGQDYNQAAAIFARSWITSLQANELGEIGAITLGGAILAAVFAPFTGSSTLSFVPVEDLSTLRLARLHRYYDSLAINAISGIGLVQLMALTGIASVLTIEGNKGPALVLAWATWVVIIVLTTSLAWTLEWVVRRWGRLVRSVTLGLLTLALVGLVLRDTYAARRLFGLGDYYSLLTRDMSDSGNIYVPLAVLALLAFALMAVGLWFTRRALNLPAEVHTSSKSRSRGRIYTNLPTHLTVLLTKVITRTPEIRKPIIAVLVLGVPILMFTAVDDNVLATLIIAVPLAVSLAWGVNLFASIGQGMPWLASQPRVLSPLPRLVTAMQASMVLGVLAILLGVAWLRGNATGDIVVSGLSGGVVAATLAASISTRLSIRRPIRARLGGRGDALIPPLTALAYLALLLMFAAAPAVFVVLGTEDDPGQRLLLVSVAVLIGALITHLNERDWRDSARRARVTAVVSSN